MSPLETKASASAQAPAVWKTADSEVFPLPHGTSIMSVCDYDPERRPDLSASYFLLQQM